MNRTDAREFMMQVFFQMDVSREFDLSRAEHYLSRKKLGEQEDYCRRLYTLLCMERDRADENISRYSRNWKISRMAKTDLAILRLAAFEILFFDDIPDAVAINEAVKLAKKYGTDHAPSFINAILGKITAAKQTGEPGPADGYAPHTEGNDQV